MVHKCEQCGKEFKRGGKPRFKHIYCSQKCYGQKILTEGTPKRFYPKERNSSAIVNKYFNLKKRAEKFNWNYPTSKEFVEWYQKQEKKCIYCDIPFETWEILYKGHQNKYSLSLDRKDNKKGYELNNLTLACSKCNVSKNDLFTFEEMKEIGQKYIKPKWQAKLQEAGNVYVDMER